MKLYSILLLLLVAATTAFGRYKEKYHMGRPLDSIPRPFITLNSGKTFYTDGIKQLRKKLIAGDNTSYKLKDVSDYCTGDHLYKRVDKKNFAEKKYQGRINIWFRTELQTVTSTSSTGAMSSHSRTAVYNYIQKGEDGPLVPLLTENVKRIIPRTDPAYKYILKREDQIRRGKKREWIGLALIVGGIALAASSDNDATVVTGGVCIPVGIITIISGYAKRTMANEYRDKAVAAYNGTLEPSLD